MKPKAQTLQQRMGFADPDLVTPKHDALMVELDSNIKHYVSTIDIKELMARIWRGSNPPVIVELQEIGRAMWEVPVMSNNRYVLGFADLVVCVKCSTPDDPHWFDVRLHFEVKPTIASIGEVIRQIRHYQTGGDPYTKYCELWVIASPDERFRSIIEAQGIGFVKLPDCEA